jgi:voltage-gated potassium channel
MNIKVPGIKNFIFGRYGSLLLALVMLMLMQLTVETTVGKYLLEAIFIAVLLTGLRAIETQKGLFGFEVILLLVSVVLSIAGTVTNNTPLFFIGNTCRVIFMAMVALTILRDLFRGRSVSGDTLAGAVCVYLLIAVIWGYFFLLIEVIVPGSFSFTQGHARMQLWISQEFFPFFYFSMVTITTVGYGDMSPVTSEAQTFATIEALIGQIYLTILVARLVGMYMVNQQVDDTSSAEEAERQE